MVFGVEAIIPVCTPIAMILWRLIDHQMFWEQEEIFEHIRGALFLMCELERRRHSRIHVNILLAVIVDYIRASVHEIAVLLLKLVYSRASRQTSFASIARLSGV